MRLKELTSSSARLLAGSACALALALAFSPVALADTVTTEEESAASAVETTVAATEELTTQETPALPADAVEPAAPAEEEATEPTEPAETTEDVAKTNSAASAEAPAPVIKRAPAADEESGEAFEPEANTWGMLDNGSRVYYGEDLQPVTGLQLIDGERYYFGDDGAMETGWKDVDGDTFFFGADGVAVRWTKFFDAPRGNLVANLQDGGAQYYFNGASQMQTGWVTWNADGTKSYFDPETGVAKSGWYTDGDGERYYFDPSNWNHSVRWTQKIEGDQYYFNGASQMVTGWVTWNADSTKSYLDPETGVAKSGWYTADNGDVYYFDPAKSNHSARWTKYIDGKRYYFNGASVMQSGLITWNSTGRRSLFEDDGTGHAPAREGWVDYDGDWYYMDPSDFESLTGVQTSLPNHSGNGSYTFDFDEHGVMQTGSIVREDTGKLGIFNSDPSSEQYGALVTSNGWTSDGSDWYYFKDDSPLRWSQIIDGVLYYFNGAGKMVTGLVRWNSDGTFPDGNTRNKNTASFFGLDDGYGHMSAQSGWHTVGSETYYMDPNKALAYPSVVWSQTIEGKNYYFNGSGVMQKGWIQWKVSSGGREAGKWSYFGDDGAMVYGKQTIEGHEYDFGTTGMTMIDSVRQAMIDMAQDFSSWDGSRYLILIDRYNCKLGVFQGARNAWNLIKYWDAGLGDPWGKEDSQKYNPTLTGTYHVGYDGRGWGTHYYYLNDENVSEDEFYDYYSSYIGGPCFATNIYDEQYIHTDCGEPSALGKYISHGCVRLLTANAKWIFENIPLGTTINVYGGINPDPAMHVSH